MRAADSAQASEDMCYELIIRKVEERRRKEVEEEVEEQGNKKTKQTRNKRGKGKKRTQDGWEKRRGSSG